MHPAFPQPADPSVAVWRYMDSSKFEWLITHRRPFMPNAERLGDPFEGTTPDGEIEWWKRQAADANTEEKRYIIAHNHYFLSQMAAMLRKQYYVGCWHKNQFENSAMWSCYTSSPESVAIMTTYAALCSLLPAYAQVGVVRYIDYATERLPSMNMFEYIMHKDAYYAFEQEVRAVVMPPVVKELGLDDFRTNHFELEAISGFLVYAPPIDTKIIQRIVLHPDAPDTYIEKIEALCVANNLPLPEASRRKRKSSF